MISLGRRWFLWSLWALLLAAAGPAALVMLWALPFNVALSGVPLLLFTWVIAGLGALIWSVLLVQERAWRKAILAAMLPLSLVVALLNFDALWEEAITTGEYIHFRVMRPRYLAEIAKLPADQGPRLVTFMWGGFGISHAVVYDESDEVMLPADRRSPAWNAKAAGSELECGVWGDPLGDHFYIVRMGC